MVLLRSWAPWTIIHNNAMKYFESTIMHCNIILCTPCGLSTVWLYCLDTRKLHKMEAIHGKSYYADQVKNWTTWMRYVLPRIGKAIWFADAWCSIWQSDFQLQMVAWSWLSTWTNGQVAFTAVHFGGHLRRCQKWSAVHVATAAKVFSPVVDIVRFSKLQYLLMITACVLRFPDPCRHRTEDISRLTATEVMQAERYWPKYVQKHNFSVEFNCIARGWPVEHTSHFAHS